MSTTSSLGPSQEAWRLSQRTCRMQVYHAGHDGMVYVAWDLVDGANEARSGTGEIAYIIAQAETGGNGD